MPRQELILEPLPAAEAVAAELIAADHPHLTEARILWLSTTGKVKCQPKVLSAFERYLSSALDDEAAEVSIAEGYDVVCVLNSLDWVEAGRHRLQAAMLDHLLSHLERVGSDEEDSTLTWRVRKHDVQEFTGVVERHGLWTESLRELGALVPQQLTLPDPVAAAPAAEDDDDAAPPERNGGPLLYDEVRQVIGAARGRATE